MAKSDREEKGVGVTFKIGPGQKLMKEGNGPLYVGPRKKAEVVKPKPRPKAEDKPAKPEAPKAEAPAKSERGQEQRFRPAPPKQEPATKKVEASKPPVYTKDAPGSDAEAYRRPLTKEENIKIATGQSRREIDDVMNALPFVGGASKLAARIGTGILKRAANSKMGREAAKYLPKDLKLLGAPPKLLTGPKPVAPRTSPPARLTGPDKPKLLEYRPEPKPRVTPKPKPRKRIEGAGTLDYKNGGRIDGAAIRGKTKGRYC